MDDEVVSVADSGIDTNYSSDMQSITSSLFRFEEREGRRFHGLDDNPYPFPNDDEELVRLDELQFIIRALYGRTVLVPLPRHRPTMVFDAGTGTGRWAIETALQFPKAYVIGMDISPVQPTDVPENCEFRYGDITDCLDDFDDGYYDFVHSRFVMLGIKDAQWRPYIESLYRMLKPGGWIQAGEMCQPTWEGNDVPAGSYYQRFRHYVREDFERRQLCANGEHLENRLRAAGFINIRVIKKVCIIGDWTGEPRKAPARRAAFAVFGTSIPALMTNLRWAIPDDDERDEFKEKVIEEYYSKNYRQYCIIYMVVGQKPEHKLNLGK